MITQKQKYLLVESDYLIFIKKRRKNKMKKVIYILISLLLQYNAMYSQYKNPSGISSIDEICGEDSRHLFNHSAVGRIWIGGRPSTGWILFDGRIVTAWHVLEGYHSGYIEFNVPTNGDCDNIKHPPAKDQYDIDFNTIQHSSNTNPGNDWAIFSVKKNSITNKMPLEAQSAFFYVEQTTLPGDLKIIGFGKDSNTPSNCYESQAAVGSYEGLDGTIIKHKVDTEGGCSGAPILNTLTNNVVGIHTNGGCSDPNVGYNRGTSMYNSDLWEAINPEKSIIVKQIREDGSNTNKDIFRWETNSFHSYPVPAPISATVGTNEFLRANTTLINNPKEKFNQWNNYNDAILQRDFLIENGLSELVSQFKKSFSSTIINNDYPEASGLNPGNDVVQFKDPWLIDLSDPEHGDSLVNQGINAPFKSRTAPFYPDYSTSYNGDIYKGVFLGESPDPNDPNKPYYSVKTTSPQTINVQGANRKFYFQNWAASPSGSATFQNSNNLETPVVFNNANATVKAVMKGTQLSNETNAYTNNNQRKFARTGGYLYSIYESMGKIWLEKSENNGETWTIINNGKPLNGDTEAKNPSFFVLGHAPETIAVVFQETDSHHPHQIRVMVSSDDFHNIEFDGVVEVLTYNYSYNCNPVISMAYNYDYGETYLIIWQSDDDLDHSAGLYYRGFAINSSDDYNFINSSTKINNTNQNSKSSTIAAIVDGSSNDNDFYLAWEQYVSSVESKIYFYRVRRTGSNSFSFFDFAEPSSGSGFTVNTAPSITVLPNGNPVLVWDGRDKIIKREKGSSGWSSFSYYGGNNPANPQARIVGSEEAIVWSESNSILKFAQGSDVYCFDIEGDYIQLTDAESLSSMKCSVFNTSSQPYYFTTVGYDDIYPSNSLPETISSDLTVTGNLTISSNTTILDGATLTILEGTTLTFQNNSKLIVNGTLNVNGTSGNKVIFDFQTPYSSDGEYNGIDIKQGGSATIYYAEIKNAQYGIKAEKTAITVENSDIHNCVIGTYLYWTNDYGFSEIHSNNLHNNSCCGLYVYHSEAKARDNQIKNNGNRGVYAGNHSTLYLGEAGYAGNNNISNNTTVGIFSDYGSYMFLGRETCTLQGGNNIVDNANLNAKAWGYGSIIQAENTWWGSNNQSTITSKFYIYHGQIYYHPWLSSAPSGVLSKSVTTPEESVYNAEFTSSDKSEPESAASEDKQYNYDSKWPIYWKLLYARNLIFVKDYKFARKICREVIDENPDSSLSVWALNLLGVASYQDDPEGFKEYLQKKTSSKEKKQLYGSMELILSGYETTKSSKEASIDKTTTKYEGTYIEEVGLLQKFMYYLNEEKDEKTARSISDELDKKFPKTVSAVEAHRFLGDDVKESEEIKGEIAKENGKDDNESIPEKYELLGNYPNPFNPSTTIKYALPFNSNVELTIYDMNGKEVRKFVINTQSKGYGNVVWDGTNNNGIQVSSGVYVYKFKAISLEGNGKVFEKSAKLMLLK